VKRRQRLAFVVLVLWPFLAAALAYCGVARYGVKPAPAHAPAPER
jgi:hypothetical protein